jgi:hypothetical protein
MKKKAPKFPSHVLWPQCLSYVGRTFFGRQWRARVAELLKVDRKTIDKWMEQGAPGWTCAHLEKVGYFKYDEINNAKGRPNYKAMRKLSDATDVLYSQRCQYRKFKGLPPPSLDERHKQVANVKLPNSRT